MILDESGVKILESGDNFIYVVGDDVDNAEIEDSSVEDHFLVY
jgi:hypothetical protein